MVTFFKDNGIMVKQMVKEHLLTLVARFMKVNGKMINSMAKLPNIGIMVDINLKVLFKMVKNKEKVNLNVKELLTLGILNLECLMVLVVITLQTLGRYTKVSFLKIKLKAWVK